MLVSNRSQSTPGRLAILPGSFNPPTRAHLALADAALKFADEVLFVLPKVLPHKEFVGASFEQRVGMLQTAVAGNSKWSIGIADQGLFIEIAGEVKPHYPDSELWFVCGRDAAERIVEWDYGQPDAIAKMLNSFGLLVARRQGEYTPPGHLVDHIKPLPFESYDEHSSTEVRERIRSGGEWRHLVPESIAEEVGRIYFQAGRDNNTMTELAMIRRWAQTWKEIGPELEQIRLREVRDENNLLSLTLLARAFNHATRTQPPDESPGLVEMQRILAKLRR